MMTHGQIVAFIDANYANFPNFDGRSAEEILAELPDQDTRFEDEAGLIDILNEVDYR